LLIARWTKGDIGALGVAWTQRRSCLRRCRRRSGSYLRRQIAD